ncbi:hypothetical protein SUGI_1091390 [Cryptomeria japonica]|nr:hypothetical protein SUGI_1091390 [Cryptomeria japonica]
MFQVHPRSSISSPHVSIDQKFCSTSSTQFEVWKKSLLFHGKGYTVFRSLGHLVLRVDKYASNKRNEALLMDDEGLLLLTLRRKKWSFRKIWEAFSGVPVEYDKPKFSIIKSLGFSNKTTANVFIDGNRLREHSRKIPKHPNVYGADFIKKACAENMSRLKVEDDGRVNNVKYKHGSRVKVHFI